MCHRTFSHFVIVVFDLVFTHAGWGIVHHILLWQNAFLKRKKKEKNNASSICVLIAWLSLSIVCSEFRGIAYDFVAKEGIFDQLSVTTLALHAREVECNKRGWGSWHNTRITVNKKLDNLSNPESRSSGQCLSVCRVFMGGKRVSP